MLKLWPLHQVRCKFLGMDNHKTTFYNIPRSFYHYLALALIIVAQNTNTISMKGQYLFLLDQNQFKFWHLFSKLRVVFG